MSINHAKIGTEIESYYQLEFIISSLRWWLKMTSLFVIATVVVYFGIMKYVLDHVLKPH
jgi:hypothetical protein